jgi:hypothetical protein
MKKLGFPRQMADSRVRQEIHKMKGASDNVRKKEIKTKNHQKNYINGEM